MSKINKNGVTYFTLHIACPVCREKGITTPQTNWIHAYNNCGGLIYVGENAYYYCDDCGHTEFVQHWKYKCPSHATSDDDYVGVGTSAAIAEVVACAGMMVNEAGQQWLIKFMQNLGEW
jgi:hypothetical protein